MAMIRMASASSAARDARGPPHSRLLADDLIARELEARRDGRIPPRHLPLHSKARARAQLRDLVRQVHVELDVVDAPAPVFDAVEEAAALEPSPYCGTALVALPRQRMRGEPLGVVEFENETSSRPERLREPAERDRVAAPTREAEAVPEDDRAVEGPCHRADVALVERDVASSGRAGARGSKGFDADVDPGHLVAGGCERSGDATDPAGDVEDAPEPVEGQRAREAAHVGFDEVLRHRRREGVEPLRRVHWVHRAWAALLQRRQAVEDDDVALRAGVAVARDLLVLGGAIPLLRRLAAREPDDDRAVIGPFAFGGRRLVDGREQLAVVLPEDRQEGAHVPVVRR